jgi:7-cyano-7-deazaguanine synthase in queuosine biosynthesis
MKIHDTHNYDYTLLFDSVMNSNGNVRCIDHSRNKESTISIAIDDSEFGCRVQQEFPSIIADLIDLAVAIHATDRLTSQNLRQEQTRIFVVLPVRHPELLNLRSFQDKLSSLLEWTTGSQWQFNFKERLDSKRVVEQQLLLSPADPCVTKVILWSGGLDALAGLYTHLKMDGESSFMLFGTGSNDNTFARQKQVFKALQPSFPNRLNLCQVPVRFSDSCLHQKNKVSRARGIVFMLLGAACAYLMGQKTLYLYENGIGAINLPYRKSAIGLDHSRSVHPLTLLRVSDIVSELLEEKFKVQNPFLFWTKAKMCKLLIRDGRSDLPPLTMSCDSPHRQQPIQCGYCSSCILRKQALAASLMEDKTRYIVPHGRKPARNPSLHLQHMLAQVSTLKGLLDVSDDFNLQWKSLARRFPELDDIVDRMAVAEVLSPVDIQKLEVLLPVDMQKHLICLYQAYVTEWDTIEPRISRDFLKQKNNQQTSDDCLVAVQEG